MIAHTPQWTRDLVFLTSMQFIVKEDSNVNIPFFAWASESWLDSEINKNTINIFNRRSIIYKTNHFAFILRLTVH